MTTMPLFSYPTTVAVIDDDQLFLKSITRILSQNHLIKTFSDSHEALNHFKNYKSVLTSVPFLRACSDYESYDEIGHMPVDINVSTLLELRNHSERNQDISVIVVDYNMPKLNGLDLCRQLRGLPVKKILLTGAVEHYEAVAAFNEGLIDRFVRKDNPNLIEEIETHITELQKQNIIDSTRGLLSHLEADHPLSISDPLFCSFFKEWCINNNIREHYLMDKQGNFIVVNNNGDNFYFIIHNEKTLAEFVALHGDDEGVSDLIDAVTKRKLIPFFGMGTEAWQKKESEWADHFYVPQLFEGKEKYFWTVIKRN